MAVFQVGTDCPAAGCQVGCGHLIAGTTRVWETIHGGNASNGFRRLVHNEHPDNAKHDQASTLGNRSFINQIKYSPKYQSVAMLARTTPMHGSGFNLGTGTASQANWVDVTGGNTVLPNRPIMGRRARSYRTCRKSTVGYAAIGGFNPNTPSMPVMFSNNLHRRLWILHVGGQDRNLPDIPVDSIIVNPNNAQQVLRWDRLGCLLHG
jgi:hypothetical protein